MDSTGAAAATAAAAAASASPRSPTTAIDPAALLMEGVAFNPADPNELYELVDLLGEVRAYVLLLCIYVGPLESMNR
jgi:hypothetical protein